MVRPVLPPEQRRDDQLNIRLTDGERVRIEYRAAALGITMAEYMRDRGLHYRLPHRAAARRANAEALTTLNRLGVNLNQLTHYANAGWLTPGTEAALSSLLSEIHVAMRGLMHGPQADGRRPRL